MSLLIIRITKSEQRPNRLLTTSSSSTETCRRT